MARLIIVEDNAELSSLIASMARSRGHVVKEAHTGRAALAALVAQPFDGAVVDLLLPDTRGGEILQELKQRHIPTVVMSGVYKGEKFVEDASRLYNVRAYFEKPFELKALLDTLEKFTKGGESEELELIEPVEVVDEDIDDEPLGLLEPEAEAIIEPMSAMNEITTARYPVPLPADITASEASPASEESEEAGPITAKYTVPPPLDHPMVRGSEAPPAPKRVDPFAETKPAPPAPPPPAPTAARASATERNAGDLSQTSVPRLLNAFYQAKHRGELKLRQSQVQKVVFFDQGRPIYAASNLANERFGRFCVKKGVIPESELAQVTALSKEKNLRTGEAMIQLGLLTAERRRELLEEQVKEIIWSTFTWKTGEYSFTSKQPRRADLEKISVFTGHLILEGVGKSETLITLREKMGPARKLFPTADPPYGLHEFRLSDPQAMLIAYADGSKTVEDLLTLTDLSHRDALATLRAFELLGLLEERQDDTKQRRISFGF